MSTSFGRGLIVPDIRKIVYWGASATLEQYVQETGSAGRDGSPAVQYHKEWEEENATVKVKAYKEDRKIL